jgi:hypothetical protein
MTFGRLQNWFKEKMITHAPPQVSLIIFTWEGNRGFLHIQDRQCGLEIASSSASLEHQNVTKCYEVYKWTHCNAQGLLSHTQQNVLKKHYEDVIVFLCRIYLINPILIDQREMSRMVLITPATMPANA